MVERPDTESMWGAPRTFEFNTAGNDGSPTLTSDERVIVWASPGPVGNHDIFFAVRADRTAPWSQPQVLSISTPNADVEPVLRDDGCELFFVRTSDIFSVRVIVP